MVTYILMDIEGTTTAIDFVHKTLFPYARTHMGAFLDQHGEEEDVRTALAEAAATVTAESATQADEASTRAALLRWIAEDRKHPALKKLQGMIWKDGYANGAYRAHLYEDVLPCWERWRAAGKRLGIYSSGSVQAQKLLFGHTETGDLNPYLSHYFDTGVGHKREAGSYEQICSALALAPAEVLFLSDVTAELDAAAEAGLKTTQLVRPGTVAGTVHPAVPDFYSVQL